MSDKPAVSRIHADRATAIRDADFVGPLTITGPVYFYHCSFIGPITVENDRPRLHDCNFEGDLFLPKGVKLEHFGCGNRLDQAPKVKP